MDSILLADLLIPTVRLVFIPWRFSPFQLDRGGICEGRDGVEEDESSFISRLFGALS